MKTRIIKFKYNGTTYVFKVNTVVGLDPTDVFKEGLLVALRSGITPTTDPKGNILGKSDRGWNAIPVTELDYKLDLKQLALAAVKRAVEHERLEEQFPNRLPRLSVSNHKNKRIIPGKGRYYVESVSFCNNCGESIPGTQDLVINRNGKVDKELPFVPTDPGVQPARKGSNKLVHAKCAAKIMYKAIPDEYVQTFGDKPEEIVSQKDAVKTTDPVLDELIRILENAEFTADFARGAAYIYALIKRMHG